MHAKEMTPQPPSPDDPLLYPGKGTLGGFGGLLVVFPVLGAFILGPRVWELSLWGVAPFLFVSLFCGALIIGVCIAIYVRRQARRGRDFLVRGRFDEAHAFFLERARTLSHLGPDRGPLLWNLAWVEFVRGNLDSALRLFGVLPRYHGYSGMTSKWTPSMIALLYALIGDVEAARRWIDFSQTQVPAAASEVLHVAKLALLCRQELWSEAVSLYRGNWPRATPEIPPPATWLAEGLARFALSHLDDSAGVPPAIATHATPERPGLFAASSWPTFIAFLERCGATEAGGPITG